MEITAFFPLFITMPVSKPSALIFVCSRQPKPLLLIPKEQIIDGRGSSAIVLREEVTRQWMSLHITQVNVPFLKLPYVLQCLQVSHML